MHISRLPFALFLVTASALAADKFDDKFRQLEESLPTPGLTRTASGAPGRAYWQQRADYKIRATLDEAKRAIRGAETVTYHNNSPDTLTYLWVQLDQNMFRADSDNRTTNATAPSREAWSRKTEADGMKFEAMRFITDTRSFAGGINIHSVTGADGKPLAHTINKTMMRIDLPQPMKPGATLAFSVEWDFNVPEFDVLGRRSGFEQFKEDKNDLFEIGQWFPRMAAYYDQQGWQNKQYLGDGEFTLEFGDYDVQLTVPADHIVASTGVLQNPDAVLSGASRRRARARPRC